MSANRLKDYVVWDTVQTALPKLLVDLPHADPDTDRGS